MTASVAEAIMQARAASDTDNDRAMALARDALARLDPTADPATAWALAELMVELGDNDAAIALVARVTGALPSADGALRHAALLTATGDDEGAVQILRDAATAYGATLEIVGALLELVLAGQGWSALDGLPSAPPAVAQMIDEVRRRADGLALADADTRSLAYALAGVVVLGGSEDEGATVAPYWFMTADEHEVAWWLRRLVGWLEAEPIWPTAVVAADAAVEPIAIALASRLELPPPLPADAPAGAIYLYSQLDGIDAAPERPDGLTVCLAVTQAPGWQALLATSPVDVVGVFAPLELSWTAPNDETPPPAATVAARILAELPNLPRDRALPAMLSFYRRHRLRARQLC